MNRKCKICGKLFEITFKQDDWKYMCDSCYADWKEQQELEKAENITKENTTLWQKYWGDFKAWKRRQNNG